MLSGRAGLYAARGIGRSMGSSVVGKSSRLSGFHKLDIAARTAALEKAGFLTTETRAAIEGRGLALDDANNMIENVLATFGIPMVKPSVHHFNPVT